MDISTDRDSDIGSDTESSCYSAMNKIGSVINDSVHKAIKLPQVCMEIIDTPEFQRLRALKQCGICNLVYPSATHSRFEHSIGVCHLALELLQNCGDSIPEDKKLCVLLAGLCHDLGHGPFSHLWERFLVQRGITWKHETNSRVVFEYLVKENNLEPLLEKCGLKMQHMDLICSLIDGTVPKNEKNVYLYEIIANNETGLDVDKFEYIKRDAQQFGMPYGMDMYRIMNHVGIVEKDGVKYIGFRDKIADNLRDVFVYRAKLHRTCYQHHTCKAVELMLIDALLAADDHFRISIMDDNNEIRRFKLSECHTNIKAFLRATDSIYNDLLYSTDTALHKSRAILEAISKRDLYTLIFRKPLVKEVSAKVDHNMMRALKEFFGCQYEFRSCFVKYSIGQDGDPLSKVKFFTKRNPGVPCELSPGDINSSFIKENYHFTELLIFCTEGKKSISQEQVDSIKSEAKTIYKHCGC